MLTFKLFGDLSERTKNISKYVFQTIVLTIIIIISIIWLIQGNMKYSSVIKRTSSPIGSQMTFARSNATLTLKDVYTDKDKNVLIVRLAPTNSSDVNLPYKGTDYQLYLSAKSLDGKKETQVIFGKMSTDGDMFLIIPNPSEDVYSVYIKNTKFISSDSALNGNNSGKSSNTADIGNGVTEDDTLSVSKALSQYQYQSIEDANKNKATNAYQIQSDDNDAITFRVTTKPQFDTDEYKVKTINANLINKENEFDFSEMFDTLFKDSAIKQLKSDHKNILERMKVLKVQLDEYQQRIEENPADQNAKSSLSSGNTKYEELQNEADDVAEKITSYQNLKYNDKYFDNIQTEASVINSKYVKAK